MSKRLSPQVLIEHHIKYCTGTWCRTYTRFLHLIDANNPVPTTAEQRANIWHRLVFYNYLTEAAGLRPRTPPPEDSWEESEPAFFTMLGSLDPRPDAVIVWGYRLWYALEQKRGWLEGHGNNVGTISWPADRSRSLPAFALKHPSAPGLKHDEWAPKLEKFITDLRNKKNQADSAIVKPK